MARQYDSVTVDSPNPLARFAHRSRYRHSVSLVSHLLESNASCLDFGCGNGRFLSTLAATRPDIQLYGHDRFSNPRGPFGLIENVAEVPDRSLDCVCAFEVLEHLFDSDFYDFVALAKRTLKENGRLIVSVPIMLGPVLIPKYFNARLVNRVSWRYSYAELYGSVVRLQSVGRYSEDSNTYTHRGFDFRSLKGRLLNEFTLEAEDFRPFPFLWWGFNSQYFSVWKHTGF